MSSVCRHLGFGRALFSLMSPFAGPIVLAQCDKWTAEATNPVRGYQPAVPFVLASLPEPPGEIEHVSSFPHAIVLDWRCRDPEGSPVLRCEVECSEESNDFMAPPGGLSTPRALKVTHVKKSENVRSQTLFSRICTILCMREAVTISYGSRIFPSPLGLENDAKASIYFWHCFQLLLVCSFF